MAKHDKFTLKNIFNNTNIDINVYVHAVSYSVSGSIYDTNGTIISLKKFKITITNLNGNTIASKDYQNTDTFELINSGDGSFYIQISDVDSSTLILESKIRITVLGGNVVSTNNKDIRFVAVVGLLPSYGLKESPIDLYNKLYKTYDLSAFKVRYLYNKKYTEDITEELIKKIKSFVNRLQLSDATQIAEGVNLTASIDNTLIQLNTAKEQTTSIYNQFLYDISKKFSIFDSLANTLPAYYENLHDMTHDNVKWFINYFLSKQYSATTEIKNIDFTKKYNMFLESYYKLSSYENKKFNVDNLTNLLGIKSQYESLSAVFISELGEYPADIAWKYYESFRYINNFFYDFVYMIEKLHNSFYFESRYKEILFYSNLYKIYSNHLSKFTEYLEELYNYTITFYSKKLSGVADYPEQPKTVDSNENVYISDFLKKFKSFLMSFKEVSYIFKLNEEYSFLIDINDKSNFNNKVNDLDILFKRIGTSYTFSNSTDILFNNLGKIKQLYSAEPVVLSLECRDLSRRDPDGVGDYQRWTAYFYIKIPTGSKWKSETFEIVKFVSSGPGFSKNSNTSTLTLSPGSSVAEFKSVLHEHDYNSAKNITLYLEYKIQDTNLIYSTFTKQITQQVHP